METSDGEIKLHSELREISVCEAVDNEKSSVPSLGRENNETRNSQDTIGNKHKIDNFSFKNDKHVCDNTKHELNPIFECHSEDVNKKNTNQMRAKINLRERKRMHDLNLAMEGLREVMPCANGPSMRKLSKIATLSLARNYIQMLTRSIEELKIMLDDAYHSQFHGPTIARRRNDVTVHPYRQLVGIRHSNISSGIASNLDSSYSPGFERYTNFQRSVISNMSTCASHGCCFRNNDAGIPRGLYHTSWNGKMP